jgi:hypothetical protein
MSIRFVTVIVRVVERASDLNMIVKSALRQKAVKQVVVVSCNKYAQDCSTSREIPEGFTEKGPIVFVSVSNDVNDRAYLIAGQIAEYEPCLLWDTTMTMPETLVDDLQKFYETDHLVGISGRRLEGASAFSTCPVFRSVEKATPVDHLEIRGMMLHRKFLRIPDTHYFERYNQNLGIWITANARRNLGAQCSVVPIRSSVLKRCAEGEEQPSSKDINEKEVDFALAYLNHSRSFRDWPEINASILPAIEPGTHFQRLKDLKYDNLLVFGCQRSGTTWLSRHIGQSFQEAFTLTEEQSFHFLLEDFVFPAIRARHVVFQTTFISTEVESYENCPHNTKFLLMIRNPFAVCWSFIHNFELLSNVYQYRKASMKAADLIPHFEGELGMALQIYRQSMRTALEIMLRCADRIQVLVYDDAVLNLEKAIGNLARFLQLDDSRATAILRAGREPLSKWRQFGEEQIEVIRSYAEPLFNQVLESADSLGIQNAI